MKFSRTKLDGLWLIELELREDERGFFARTYCDQEFTVHGLNTRWPQCNLSHTKQRGMLRGMHFQADPKPEIKLVRCAAGAIYDVLVDVRRDSPTFGQWEGFELTAQNRRTLYVPGGFADVVRAGRLCPRFSMSDGQLRSVLPDVGVLRAGIGARTPLQRPAGRHHLADRKSDALRARPPFAVAG